MNPVAVAMATREGKAAGTRGAFFVCDVLQHPIPEGYDAIICSLFLHHLSTEEGGLVLANMAASARHLVLVSDLIRSRAGLALVYLATDYPGGETEREAVETCLRVGLPGDILNRVRSVTLHLATP